MGYEELLKTLRARNIVRVEWTVYYYKRRGHFRRRHAELR
jgi:hypothetical protein